MLTLARTGIFNSSILKSIVLISTALTYSHSSFATELDPSTTNGQTTIPTLITQAQSRPHYVYLDARLEAVNQSTISAQTSGIVEAVRVDVNDRVEAGQTLVLLNNTQQKAQLSQAMANLTHAQAQNEDAQVLLQRNRSLLAKRTLSQGEFDSSVARAKSAQAQVAAYQALLKQAQEQLSYTHIKAPYSGIVRERMIQIGELVNPGQPLMTGFALQPLRAISDIPKHLTPHLMPPANATTDNNHAADILIITPKHTITAASYTLFPYADSRYSSIRARINLPMIESLTLNSPTINNTELTPGSWVKIALPIGQKQGIYLPSSAIVQYGEIASIYIKQNNRFKLRYVRLGNQLESQDIEIISGLEINEHVAIDALAAAASISSSHVNTLKGEH